MSDLKLLAVDGEDLSHEDGTEDPVHLAVLKPGEGLFNQDGKPFRFGNRRYVWVGGTKCYRSYSDYVG